MKKTGPLLAAILFVVVIIGICVGSVIYANSDFHLFDRLGWHYQTKGAELRNTIELDTTDATRLEITYGSDDVYFYQGESNQIVVKEYLLSDAESAQASVTQTQDDIRIQGGYTNYWMPMFWFGGQEHIDIYLPAEMLAALKIKIQSGNVYADMVMEAPEMELQVSSGNIEFQELRAQNLTVDVSSGNIEIERIQTESGRLDVRSGDIDIYEYTGVLDARVTSGNIDLYMKELTGDIDVSCKSGNIDLYLPSDSAFTFTSRVSSGDVDSDFEGIMYDSDGRAGSGTVGKNPQYTVSVDVTSGNVNLEQR